MMDTEWLNKNILILKREYEVIKSMDCSCGRDEINEHLDNCTCICYNLCGLYNNFSFDDSDDTHELIKNGVVTSLLAALRLCSLSRNSIESMSRLFRGISMCYSTSGKIFYEYLEKNEIDTLDDYNSVRGMQARKTVQLGDNVLLGVYSVGDAVFERLGRKRYAFRVEFSDNVSNLRVVPVDEYSNHFPGRRLYHVQGDMDQNVLSFCCDVGSATERKLKESDFMWEVTSPIDVKSLLDKKAASIFSVDGNKEKIK